MRNPFLSSDQYLTFCLLLWSASTFIVCAEGLSTGQGPPPPPSPHLHIWDLPNSSSAGLHRRSDWIVREWKLLRVGRRRRVSLTPRSVPSHHTPRLLCLHAWKMGQTPPSHQWSMEERPLVLQPPTPITVSVHQGAAWNWFVLCDMCEKHYFYHCNWNLFKPCSNLSSCFQI